MPWLHVMAASTRALATENLIFICFLGSNPVLDQASIERTTNVRACGLREARRAEQKLERGERDLRPSGAGGGSDSSECFEWRRCGLGNDMRAAAEAIFSRAWTSVWFPRRSCIRRSRSGVLAPEQRFVILGADLREGEIGDRKQKKHNGNDASDAPPRSGLWLRFEVHAGSPYLTEPVRNT